ncbi:phenylacetate--CoA ligase family protein [Roseateles sp. BYS180W]|uniref:Phenylacetate--CoA ligase family protein n=1 Tax=Roseateles rivi TaxID=3299028 RepID=A0ABW7FTZ9_9BURK
MSAQPASDCLSRHASDPTALTLLQAVAARRAQPWHEAALLAALNANLAHARTHSPHYRRTLAAHPQPLPHVAALARLPLTHKDDLRAAYPWGLCAVPAAQLARYAESTGTTGGVNAGFVTQRDWLLNHYSVALAWADVLGPQDRVAVAVPYELSYVGADVDRACELLGASVLPVSTNNAACSWRQLLGLLQSHRITTLVCAPLRALRLVLLAREMGLDVARDLAVRRIVCVGEALSAAKRQRIARDWQAQVYNHYGMTEALSVALPCAAGALHLAQERFVFELLDPQHERPLSGPGTGELVLTTLDQQALPLLRYRSGDLVRLSPTPCACGRWQATIELLGRVQDLCPTAHGPQHLSALDALLLEEPGIEDLFTTRAQDGQVHISVLPRPGQPWAPTRQRLDAAVAQHWGGPVQWQVQPRQDWLQRLDSRSKPASALLVQPPSPARSSP